MCITESPCCIPETNNIVNQLHFNKKKVALTKLRRKIPKIREDFFVYTDIVLQYLELLLNKVEKSC